MAEQHSFKIPAHHNIYSGTTNRELRIDVSAPQNGVNEHTGLVVLVPGFGGNIDSNVYIKMRNVFADQFNLVTIQCDYFGSVYMQGANNINIANNQTLEAFFAKDELEIIKKDSSMLMNLLQGKDIIFPMKAAITESLEEFNDMGYMQAIDIINSIETAKIVLKDNNLKFNSNRIIGYGHSHGAYLLHLSNILRPNLFSYIIDNSAWIQPSYMSSNRILYQRLNKAILAIEFNYLAKKVIKNINNLNLKMLYSNYSGNAQILSFQGNNDNLVDHKEKRDIIDKINNSKFILITEKDIDNKKYKTNAHGLGADFLELFSYALEYELPKKLETNANLKYVIYFEGVQIDVDMTYELSLFNFQFK